jgi:hypothetical protein
VAEQRWFYRGIEEWQAFVERLKLIPWLQCQIVGALIRHGFLYGFDDASPRRKSLRAHRILCSNRNARPGCGRTFSVWAADNIRRLAMTTSALWRFLQHAVAHGSRAASRAGHSHLSDRSLLRVWHRFNRAQSKIRTALCGCCPPPQLAAAHQAAAHVLAHLQAAFPTPSVPSLPSS